MFCRKDIISKVTRSADSVGAAGRASLGSAVSSDEHPSAGMMIMMLIFAKRRNGYIQFQPKKKSNV